MEAPVLQLPVFTDELDEQAPQLSGAELAAALPGELGGLSDDELLAVAADARRVASWAQARELAAIGLLHRRRLAAEEDGDPDYRVLGAHETVVQETSAALGITDHAAADLVHLADRLDGTLTGTRRALETGHIDKAKALVLDELTLNLAPELIERIEDTVLPTANRRSTGQLRRRIRDLIKRLAPEQLKQRKREAIGDRRLAVWDDEYSGTSSLTVSGLDPVQAHGTFNRITAAARGIKADGDPRSLHQLRADLAQQLLHGHPLPEAIRRARASVYSEDAGRDAACQETDARRSEMTSGGVAVADGPVNVADLASDAMAAVIADLADRELAALRDQLKATGRGHALPFRMARAAHDIHDRLADLRETWCRTHDPAHGRTIYRPSGSMRRVIEARHVTCAYPTCNRRSGRCDLDHVRHERGEEFDVGRAS